MSPVTLTFQFLNIDQAAEFCARCFPHKTHAEVTNPSVTHPIVATVLPAAAETAAQLDAAGVDTIPAAEAPKRRGRPPKAAAVASMQVAPGSGEAVPPPATAVAPTHEQAVAAQKALYEAKGAEACIVVLQRHGASRISQIQPDQRARFIKDCEDTLAGKDISASQAA